ncbi:MAG TPA: signal recognition particle-docking protein FtsY, partial [Rhodobacteraceae bacterium]|nr:signal recognition particle-docking protein FtsY [Paracoccaceae bacterium]
MSFFSKLKDRMFKSSSKLDEGLKAIVEEGGTEEPAPQPAPDPAPDTTFLAPESRRFSA